MKLSSSPAVRGARLLCALGCALLVAKPSAAIDLVVYNSNNNGPGSLRQAVTDNNGLGGGNTIVFSNTVTGTIALVGEMVISTNVTILGPGPDRLIVNGSGSGRIFNVSGGTATISGLAIDNGYVFGDGGGILNAGTLHLSNCLFTANTGSYGGAVSSSVSLTASRCAFVGNSARVAGGALALSGSAFVNNSAIISNGVGGGAIVNGFGGGTYSTGEMTLSGCTIVGNSCIGDGGGIYSSNGMTVSGCTIVANISGYGGGGINGSATVRNTVIAGNNAAPGPDVKGSFISGGNNLIGKTDGSIGWGAVGDQLGIANSPINPNLLPLGNYGGATQTMPPNSGSPAIDQGKNFGATTDQRGRPRTYDNPGVLNATLGDGTDIGAVEVGPVSFVVANTNDNGSGSLRQTILDASPDEGDTVTFAPNVTNTITLTSGQIDLNKRLEIIGPGARLLRISGNNASRVFNFSGGNVDLYFLTIADGAAAEGGGIRVEKGSHYISYCQIVSNAATATLGSGGGVLLTSNATLNLLNSSIAHNRADYSGGGIVHSGSASLTIASCTIASNRVTHPADGFFFPRGAGVALAFGDLTVFNSTIASNASTSHGGGVDNQSFNPGTVDIRNSIVAGNSAPNFGPDVAGSFISGGYNLIGNSSGGSGFGATGDQLNVSPLLGPLADYGGLTTPTMALRAGSPAIDKGKSFGWVTDQRVFPRPLDDPTILNATGGDGADIGAFEVDPNFRIVEIRRVGNDVTLSLMTMLGRNYRAEHTNNLASGPWTTFTNSVPGNGWLLWVTNYGGANQPQRFYRGAIVP